MFDQSLSVRNFRKIYNLDRKNKGNLEKDYFPVAHGIRLKINFLKNLARSTVIRYKKREIAKSQYEAKKERIKQIILLRKEKLNFEIDSELSLIVNRVNEKGYSLPLKKQENQISSKDVYSIGKDVDTVFVSRHVQSVLTSLYQVRTNNRDVIIGRLSTILKDASPKYIIRADIKSFYETIDHDALLSILHSSTKLSVTPRRILTQLIRSYSSLTSSNKGLPRGVGISAYLSEVYMSSIDIEVKSLLDLTYYERYVDDFVMIFSPDKAGNIAGYRPSFENIIASKMLTLNSKTRGYNLYDESSNNFEYLGYGFTIHNGECRIKLSNSRKNKIKERITKSFDDYASECSKTPKLAAKKLLLRMRFLTGNTRLLNNKSNAFVGVYFSNKFITDSSDLCALDRCMRHRLSLLPASGLKKRLDKMSFLKGYEDRVFRSFNIKELSLVSKGWRI